MSALPPGWGETTIGGAFSVKYGKALAAALRSETGTVPVFGSAGEVGWHNASLTAEPCLIVGRKGNAGSVFLSESPAWPIDTTYFLTPTRPMNLRWVTYYMTLVGPGLRDSSTTIPSLRREDLEACALPLPPLAEQRRIVEAIEEQFSRLDAGVASLRRAQRNLSRMRESIVRHLLTDPSWPLRQLGDISDVVGGVTRNAQQESQAGLVEVPYLRVANVQRGRLDLTEMKTVRVAPERAQALSLKPGDLLLNEGGDRDKLGRGWIWEGQIPGCIHQNHVFRARLTPTHEPKFVSLYANSFGREWFDRNGSQTTNLASISRTKLRQFPVPSPCREEQQRVVAEIERQFSILDAMEATVTAGLARAERLRQSILREAFAGRLVPQDPDDEPASTLLERIAAERTTA